MNRRYLIPNEVINTTGLNVISVRVYDSFMNGGFHGGPFGIYIDED